MVTWQSEQINQLHEQNNRQEEQIKMLSEQMHQLQEEVHETSLNLSSRGLSKLKTPIMVDSATQVSNPSSPTPKRLVEKLYILKITH